MTSNHTMSVGEALQQFLKDNNLNTKLSHLHISDYWTRVVGKLATPYTRSLEIKDDTLYVKISNAALRNELFIRRYDIVNRINEEAGYQIIKKIHLS